ncbi:hypothetical protein SETIT_9G297900v2 [Setaria italica]|uniref:Major facilitator superfamily (MFS) profile domain-containing protein n=1 Tax=Setaria italica TaxID=4555 RepID=A0A368SM94_SETIT|nr:hypothetical protein SETIT_9G297900v2 [Setaria italica]
MDADDEERPLIRHLPQQDVSSELVTDGTVDINNKPALKQTMGSWRACFFVLGAEFTECVASAAGRDAHLTVSAFLPLLMDSSYHRHIHHVAAYLGLYLVALGNDGNKPCTTALGADQFDATDPVERVSKGSFFNWFYFSISIGFLLSATVVVWVQDNIGWGVVVAAVSNYNLVLPEDCFFLHEVPSPTEGNCKIQHTSQFRLCTVSQVEDLKMLLRMFPVCASMMPFFAVTAQMSSTFIEQGASMDNRVGPFAIPPVSLATFDNISVMVSIQFYDGVLVSLARRATGKERGLSQLQRLGVGLALSVVGTVYAALVEARRLALMMWQAPAYAVLGAGEVFTAIGILEFLYDQSPDGMKSLGSTLAQLAVAVGNYFNSAVLATVSAVTARGGRPGWIPDDLNEGHLNYFFWLMAALVLVNLLHFLHFSMRYRGSNNNTDS